MWGFSETDHVWNAAIGATGDVAGRQPQAEGEYYYGASPLGGLVEPAEREVKLPGLDSVPLARPLPATYQAAEHKTQTVGTLAIAVSQVEWKLQMLLRDVRQAEDLRMREAALDSLVEYLEKYPRILWEAWQAYNKAIIGERLAK